MTASFRSLSVKATILVCGLCLMTCVGVLAIAFWSMRQETFAQLEQNTNSARARASDVVGKIGQTVARMDGMTQQNAALAEQSAASATALSTKIRGLGTLVAQFHTGRQRDSKGSQDRLRGAA